MYFFLFWGAWITWHKFWLSFIFDSVVFAVLYISQADKITQYPQSTQSSKMTFCGVVVTHTSNIQHRSVPTNVLFCHVSSWLSSGWRQTQPEQVSPFSWLLGWRVTSPLPSDTWLVAWNEAAVTTRVPFWKVQIFSIWRRHVQSSYRKKIRALWGGKKEVQPCIWLSIFSSYYQNYSDAHKSGFKL